MTFKYETILNMKVVLKGSKPTEFGGDFSYFEKLFFLFKCRSESLMIHEQYFQQQNHMKESPFITTIKKKTTLFP